MIIPTASIIFFTTVPLYGGIKLCKILDAQVVRIPFVTNISLSAIGIPVMTVIFSFLLNRLSAWFACSRASFSQIVMKEFKSLFVFIILSRHAFVSSIEEILLSFNTSS